MTKQAKWALLLLGLAVAASCAFLLLRPKASGQVAVIKQDGVVLREIDLGALDEAVIFTVKGENGLCNTVVAEPGRIRVQSATCPDQVCVRQGWTSDGAVPIVCLPNKLVIEIREEEASLDAVAK